MFKYSHSFMLLSVASFCFVLYRSIVLDITNDEAFSFRLAHEISSNFKVCKNLMVGTANTHWLNSVFLFLQSHLLGTKPWMLRIHSSFSILLCSYSIYKIFLPHEKLLLIPIILVILLPYQIDFFSLARGYALCLSLLLFAIYHILKSPFSNPFKEYSILSLSVFSSYTSLYFLMSYGLLELVHQVKTNGFKVVRSFSFYKERAPAILILIWALPNILFIKFITKDLEEGERNGYIKDTISYFLKQNYEGLPNWFYLSIGALLFVIVIAFYILNKSKIPSGWKLLFEVYFITVLIIQLNYYIFNVPYPWGRTSILANLPLLLGASYGIVFYCQSWKNLHKNLLIGLLLIIQLGSFLSYKKIQVTHEFPKQQGLKEFTNRLQKNMVSTNTKITMSLDHYGSYINYYQYLQPRVLPQNVVVYNNRFGYSTSSFGQIIQLKDTLLQQDYLLMHGDYHPFLDSIIPLSRQHVIWHFEDMQSDLLRITSP